MQTHLMDELSYIMNESSPGDSAYALASYVFFHIDEVAVLSIDGLARKASLSSATVSRIIGRIGYDNYREFRDDCAYLSEHFDTETARFTITPSTIAPFLADTLGTLASQVSETQLDLFLRYLRAEHAAVLLGIVNTRSIAEHVQYNLAFRHELNVVVPRRLEVLDDLTTEDTVIAFSATGSLFERMDLQNRLRTCSARRLLVTTTENRLANLPFHDVIVLPTSKDGNLVNNYVLQLFVDMALCRAGYYD